jgi:hypothetical protein
LTDGRTFIVLSSLLVSSSSRAQLSRFVIRPRLVSIGDISTATRSPGRNLMLTRLAWVLIDAVTI